MGTPIGPAATGREGGSSFADGRDELNLADFPISVLQRQPPRDPDGRKRDQVVFEATSYDPLTRRRVPQRVTLTTSSRYGLPTPADENVVLALLYISKHANNFESPRVHFSPLQLFRIMRWDGNSRSYARLSQVLLRLKSLTLLYENAWWDASGRRYEEEFATGIVAEYRLVKSRIRRKSGEDPPSYVHWTPRFHQSLANGNLKKLDLDCLFALTTPTAQRMYRFLDKRFYAASLIEIDLREFACGHLGVTDSENVAELKRRIAPAIAELEACGYLEPLDSEARYVKVRKGIWRVRFRRGVANAGAPPAPASAGVPALSGSRAARAAARLDAGADAAEALVRAFYEAWAPGREATADLAGTDRERARLVMARHGAAEALALVPKVVVLMRKKFPGARRFGAAVPFFEEAWRAEKSPAGPASSTSAETTARILEARRRQAERQREEDTAFLGRWGPVWERLPEADREAIRTAVMQAHPYLAQPLLRHAGLAHRFFLEELARQAHERDPSHDPDAPPSPAAEGAST